MPSTPVTYRNTSTSPNKRDKDATPAKGKRVADKVVDLGPSVGPHDTAAVREKVRVWHAQGGGVIAADDDIVVVEHDTESEVVQKEKTKTIRKEREEVSPLRLKSAGKAGGEFEAETQTARVRTRAGREMDAERKAWTRRRGRTADLEDDIKNVSAPKKRVVSDEHWRQNRSHPKTVEGPGAEIKHVSPKVKSSNDGIRVRPMKDISRSPTRSPPLKRVEVKTTYKFATLPDDGIRVRPTKRVARSRPRSGERLEIRDPARAEQSNSRKHSTSVRKQQGYLDPASAQRRRRRPSGSNSSDRSEDDGPNSWSPPFPPKESNFEPKRTPIARKVVSKPESGSEDDTRRIRWSSFKADPSQGHSRKVSEDGPVEEARSVRIRPSTAGLAYEKDVKVTSESTSANPPKVFGNRVEAWLTNTPDPFAEDQGRPAERISILKAGNRNGSRDSTGVKLENARRNGSVNVNVEEVESPRTANQRWTRARSSELHLNSADLGIVRNFPSGSNKIVSADFVGDASAATPPALLKRSGVKRNLQSPTRGNSKPSPSRDYFYEKDEVSSVASSSIEASTIDVPDIRLNKHSPGMVLKRPFPTTGKRLSTIASVETFNTRVQAAPPSVVSEISEQRSEATLRQHAIPEDTSASEAGDTFDPNSLSGVKGRGASLKRKLTTHADLISVLSMPNNQSKSIMSARSIRTNRSRLATATVEDLMNELASDEAKYTRELRTLVDGVISVLLSCVLSKSDTAVAAGLFGRSPGAHNDSNVTKPIIDMGVALERLKTVHKRIPQQDPNALLAWARGAQRVYADYLKAWRLGFQDVVVNLAPAVEDDTSLNQSLSTKEQAWEAAGLPRNEEGYIINGDGERVDVAFLLKRPLVRLKYLAKTLKGINYVKPSEQAESLAIKYQDLVIEARKRSNEERARLEDEAATNIDPTRARDPRSLAPLAGVSIDPHRRVRARDYFDMNLQHSSGQQLDCRIELLLRDDDPDRGTSGDVLFCEVSSTGRWLLFPPVHFGRISARNGDREGQIIVMISGVHSGGQNWQELLSLQSSDEQAGFEWVQMLGLTPVPPSLSTFGSFMRKQDQPTSNHDYTMPFAAPQLATPVESRAPSPSEIEVPIGELAKGSSRQWSFETPKKSKSPPSRAIPESPPSKERNRLQKKNRMSSEGPALRPVIDDQRGSDQVPLQRGEVTADHPSPRSLNEAMMQAGGGSTLRRSKATKQKGSASLPVSPSSPTKKLRFEEHKDSHKRAMLNNSRAETPEPPWTPTTSSVSQSSRDYKVWMPSQNYDPDASSEEEEAMPCKAEQRPQMHRRTSSVPSLELPSIPKVRKNTEPSTPCKPGAKDDRDSGAVPSFFSKFLSSSAPSKLQKKPPDDEQANLKTPTTEAPPPPPLDRSSGLVQVKGFAIPRFAPAPPGPKTHRRSSSPLKHEYAPSTASESSSESCDSALDDEASATSESSDDEELHVGHAASSLPPLDTINPFRKVSPPASLYSFPNATLSPSQSASQIPYRTVPEQSGKASKTIACIFSWSEQGLWESLHPNECSIVITPGLIEAFEMSAAHSRPSSSNDHDGTSTTAQRPLVALELTPLVPLRRGTALDISIRSPPTSNSKIRSSNNIMFRSRNPEECEALYALINQSRIDNPTYIALQNARGPYGESNWGAAMDRRNGIRTSSGSWWPRRKNSYRASSTRASSLSIAATDSSVGSMNSAFSALKRFGSGSHLFNVAKSTIASVDGGKSSTTDSLSSGSSTPVFLDPSKGTPLGLRDVKIRLYARETASKWRDMGSARLTIMLPPRAAPGVAASLAATPRQTGMERRILINGKTKGELLLDVTLGESCFERVARTGIAVSVWEEATGPNGEVGQVGAVGGVSSARARVYMIQMKSERHCAYTFSLVGKQRY